MLATPLIFHPMLDFVDLLVSSWENLRYDSEYYPVEIECKLCVRTSNVASVTPATAFKK